MSGGMREVYRTSVRKTSQGRVTRRAGPWLFKQGLFKAGGHIGVVAYHGLPDITGLIPAIESLIDCLAAELGVHDISRVGIGIGKVIVQSAAQFSDSHVGY